MVTDNINPNADGATNDWNPVDTHYNLLDEDEGSPNTTDYISAVYATSDDNKIDIINFNSLESVNEVTQVVVWSYGKRVGDNTPEIDLDIGGWQGYQECAIGTSWGWTSNTFGGLSASQSDLDGLQVRYRGDVPEKDDENLISCIYCVITYTEIPAPEKWAKGKVLGIPAEKIGKVMGIPIEKIAKIKGI